MKKYSFTIILLLCVCLSLTAQAIDADWTRFLATITENTFISDFSLSIEQSATQPLQYKGKIKLYKASFYLKALSYEAAYDGQTLYVYDEDTEEITLTTPTIEELNEINPLLYIQSLAQIAQMQKQITDNHIIFTLKPYSQKDKKCTITLQKTTFLPLSATLLEGTQKTIIRFQNASIKKDENTIYQLSYPQAFVNDLR